MMGNIYTAAMGMITYQNKLNVVGDNIANSRTTGYKADHETMSVFEEGLRVMIQDGKSTPTGNFQHQVHVDNVQTNFNPGAINLTNQLLDVTLVDSIDTDNKRVSFFEIDINGETYLTRDGSFEVDSAGYLTTTNGGFVLDANGQRIQIPLDTTISFAKDGRVLNSETGEEIATLQVRSVPTENTGYLEKVYGNYYRVVDMDDLTANYGSIENILNNFDTNTTIRKVFKNREVLEQALTTGQINIFAEGNVSVMQGALEASNVDLAYEMTEMLVAQKGFSANAKAVQVIDKINEKDAMLGA